MNKKYFGTLLYVISCYASQSPKNQPSSAIQNVSRSEIVRTVSSQSDAFSSSNQNENVQGGQCIMDLLSHMTPAQFDQLWRALSNRTNVEFKESKSE